MNDPTAMKMRYERAVKADEEIKEENMVREEFTVNNKVGTGLKLGCR